MESMATECTPLHMLHVLGKKHAAVLLEEMNTHSFEGFNHTVKRLKISPKVLSERLFELESFDLIIETGDSYEITSKGKELVALFTGIKTFHLKYGETSPECTEQLCAHCQTYAAQALKR